MAVVNFFTRGPIHGTCVNELGLSEQAVQSLWTVGIYELETLQEVDPTYLVYKSMGFSLQDIHVMEMLLNKDIAPSSIYVKQFQSFIGSIKKENE